MFTLSISVVFTCGCYEQAVPIVQLQVLHIFWVVLTTQQLELSFQRQHHSTQVGNFLDQSNIMDVYHLRMLETSQNACNLLKKDYGNR